MPPRKSVAPEQAGAASDSGGSAAEEEEEEQTAEQRLLAEMERLRSKMDRARKVSRKKRRELKKKAKLRLAASVQTSGIGEELLDEEDRLFDLSAIRSREALSSVGELPPLQCACGYMTTGYCRGMMSVVHQRAIAIQPQQFNHSNSSAATGTSTGRQAGRQAGTQQIHRLHALSTSTQLAAQAELALASTSAARDMRRTQTDPQLPHPQAASGVQVKTVACTSLCSQTQHSATLHTGPNTSCPYPTAPRLSTTRWRSTHGLRRLRRGLPLCSVCECG